MIHPVPSTVIPTTQTTPGEGGGHWLVVTREGSTAPPSPLLPVTLPQCSRVVWSSTTSDHSTQGEGKREGEGKGRGGGGEGGTETEQSVLAL